MRDSKIECSFVDGSIPGIIELLGGLDSLRGSALVRSWDSQRDPEKIAKSLESLGVPAQVKDEGALVRLEDLRLHSLDAVFFGFDEVWIGPETTQWAKIRLLPPMTSDAVNVCVDGGRPYMDALALSGAVLALGDGCGVNIVSV